MRDLASSQQGAQVQRHRASEIVVRAHDSEHVLTFPILGKTVGETPISTPKRIFLYVFNDLMVRAAGLEPARPFGLEILSLVRLPFRQARTALMRRAGERYRFLSTSVLLQDVLYGLQE